MLNDLQEPLLLTTTDLSGHVDQVLGRSKWHTIDQSDVDAFGATTRDEQWIHTDPRRAEHGPFGGAIAHGYLTLSLATSLVDEVLVVEDALMIVNYGMDRVRFPAPLPVGADVRAEVGLAAVRDFPGGVQVTLHLVYEVAGQQKPCCVADVLIRYYHAAGDLRPSPGPGRFAARENKSHRPCSDPPGGTACLVAPTPT